MVLPIDCAVYDLFYGPETWRRQQAAAFATTIRGSVDFFERKENPTFLIQKDSCPQKALKDSLKTFQKEKKIFVIIFYRALIAHSRLSITIKVTKKEN